MNLRKLPLQLLLTVVVGGGIAAAAGTSVPWHGSDTSALRLSWSAHPERIETCRERTAEELASRPAHMRQPLECAGAAATYLLTVLLDGQLLDSAVVRGSGIRNDRPIFLLREYPVPPGSHQLAVSFSRREQVDSLQSGTPNDSTGPAPSRATVGAMAPHVELTSSLHAAAGTVALVTLQEGELVLVQR